jgi:hypothetical protein
MEMKKNLEKIFIKIFLKETSNFFENKIRRKTINTFFIKRT